MENVQRHSVAEMGEQVWWLGVGWVRKGKWLAVRCDRLLGAALKSIPQTVL